MGDSVASRVRRLFSRRVNANTLYRPEMQRKILGRAAGTAVPGLAPAKTINMVARNISFQATIFAYTIFNGELHCAQ